MTDQDLDQHVKNLMFDIMLVLYSYGIKNVNVGAIMRLLGVKTEVASKHDNEEVELTKEFAKYVWAAKDLQRPDNETLH